MQRQHQKKREKREKVEGDIARQRRGDRKENRGREREKGEGEKEREHRGPIQHNNPDSLRFHYANAYFKASPS